MAADEIASRCWWLKHWKALNPQSSKAFAHKLNGPVRYNRKNKHTQHLKQAYDRRFFCCRTVCRLSFQRRRKYRTSSQRVNVCSNVMATAYDCIVMHFEWMAHRAFTTKYIFPFSIGSISTAPLSLSFSLSLSRVFFACLHVYGIPVAILLQFQSNQSAIAIMYLQ